MGEPMLPLLERMLTAEPRNPRYRSLQTIAYNLVARTKCAIETLEGLLKELPGNEAELAAYLADRSGQRQSSTQPAHAVGASGGGMHEVGRLLRSATRGGPGNAYISGGEGEIRTHEALANPPVFKTGAINRSATSPL
jgi:hypothetical protein